MIGRYVSPVSSHVLSFSSERSTRKVGGQPYICYYADPTHHNPLHISFQHYTLLRFLRFNFALFQYACSVERQYPAWRESLLSSPIQFGPFQPTAAPSTSTPSTSTATRPGCLITKTSSVVLKNYTVKTLIYFYIHAAFM